MRYLLAKAHRAILEQYACSRTMLVLDFDGTLAPIVADRERAAMRPATRRLLRGVARTYPCVVLSGRSRADVARRVRGVPVAEVIGNHGMESGGAPARTVRRVRLWAARLEERLAGTPGVSIEDKGLSLAIHYRASRQKKRARQRVLEAVAALGEVRMVGGKHVVNVLPAGAPHKGLAVVRARARLGCDTAIFLGDDETDEDVFSLDQPGRLLSIRVGRKAFSAAPYYVRTQREVDRVLASLLAARRGAATVAGVRRVRG
jgi:trehalose 6-phosphate phosphatase